MTIKELKVFLGWCNVEEIIIVREPDYASIPKVLKTYFKGDNKDVFKDFLNDETIDSFVIDDVYAISFGVVNGRTRLTIWLP